MPPTIDPAVDAYLKKLPKDQQAALAKVRAELRKALPEADEGMSYGLPAFKRGKSPIFGYGARPAYLSLYPMSGDVVEKHGKDLARYEVTKGSIKFDAAKGFPASLLRKLLKTRLAETGEKPTAKRAAKKPKASGDVDALLTEREHPLEPLIQELRKIVRGASPAIRERWKWNAPSFYVDPEGALDPEDVPMDRNIANVNLHREKEAMLVFLYPHGLPDDLPDWLEGSWKDRRTASFRTAAEVRARKAALQRMLREMARRVPS